MICFQNFNYIYINISLLSVYTHLYSNIYVSFKVKVALFSINKTTIVDSRRGDIERHKYIKKQENKHNQNIFVRFYRIIHLTD